PMPTIPAEVAPAGPPVAAVRVVKNTYHGVAVADPYQWLEADTPEVKAWSDGQDAYARRIVEQLPDVATVRAELAKILDAPIATCGDFKAAATHLFARRKRPGRQQAELVALADPEHAANATLIFDPITEDHPARAVDWYVPSPDGTKLAIAASDKGSENADL